MTETEARQLLRDCGGFGGLEAWITTRRWRTVPGDWTVTGELQGYRSGGGGCCITKRIEAWPDKLVVPHLSRRDHAFTRKTVMPMRAYRASTAYAGAHVKDNLWLWVGVFTALTVGAWLLLWSDALGQAGRWGDLGTLFAMVLGVLIIMVSHQGYEAPADVEDDLPPPA